MKKLITLLAAVLIGAGALAQDRELLIIGTMHQVPGIVGRSYSPLLRAAVSYTPDAILTEDIMPWDSVSLRNFTPRFLAFADSASSVSGVDEQRMIRTLQKELSSMSHEDFEFLRDCYLRNRDRANYCYYDYLANFGLSGSAKPHGNETDDLTHRLAIAMGIRTLLPIDDHLTDMEYHRSYADAVNSGIDNGDAQIYIKLNKKINRARIVPALIGRLGKHTNSPKVLDMYYQLNSVRYAQHPNEKTESAMSYWDGRNERMAQHISEQLRECGSHRAILVVGAGHVISLKNALSAIDPNLKVVLLR